MRLWSLVPDGPAEPLGQKASLIAEVQLSCQAGLQLTEQQQQLNNHPFQQRNAEQLLQTHKMSKQQMGNSSRSSPLSYSNLKSQFAPILDKLDRKKVVCSDGF